MKAANRSGSNPASSIGTLMYKVSTSSAAASASRPSPPVAQLAGAQLQADRRGGAVPGGTNGPGAPAPAAPKWTAAPPY